MGVAESPSVGCFGAPAFDHDGASNTNRRATTQIEREIRFARTAIVAAESFSGKTPVTYSAIRGSTENWRLRFEYLYWPESANLNAPGSNLFWACPPKVVHKSVSVT